MSNSWDDYADSWDMNPDVAAYADKAFDSLCQVISLDGLKVLDFGCGTGKLSEKLAKAGASVVAIDTSSKMIAVLERKQLMNVIALQGEVSADVIKTNPAMNTGFDLIVASSVCAFVADFGETLANLKQLLKVGGTFIQWDWLKSTPDADFGFTPDIIIEAYANAGLSLVRVEHAFSMSSEQGAMPVLMGIARS